MGDDTTASGAQAALAERWNGNAWVAEATPPVTGALRYLSLSGVSCPTATWCVAVGTRSNTAPDDYTEAQRTAPLVEQWNGTSWVVTPTSTPAGGSLGSLAAVSCPTTSACTAVGLYDRRRHTVALVQRWNGARWRPQSTPAPTPGPGQVVEPGLSANSLQAVSCPTVDDCTAAGGYATSTQDLVPLLEHWGGSRWRIQPSPRFPFEYGGGVQTAFAAVSCASADACTAVGGMDFPPRASSPWVEAWNDRRWTIQKTPRLTGTPLSSLFGVSCASPGGCTAVGSRASGNETAVGAQMPLAEHGGA